MTELFLVCVPLALTVIGIEYGPRLSRYLENARIDRELYGA